MTNIVAALEAWEIVGEVWENVELMEVVLVSGLGVFSQEYVRVYLEWVQGEHGKKKKGG